MDVGEASHPIGDVTERRQGWNAERNLVVFEDDAQPRLAHSRLIKSAHFGIHVVSPQDNAAIAERAATKIISWGRQGLRRRWKLEC
jgi:hypothetical protein